MKFTRSFALLLILLLLFFCMGCEKIDLSGGKNHSANTGGTQTGDPETLVVKTTLAGDDAFRPQGGASPKAEKILTHIEQVEKQTGYTVRVETVSEEALSKDFLRACKAGSKYADVIQTDAMFLSRYYGKGYFLPLADAGLDSSQTGTLKTVDGIAYALRADGWNNPLPTLSYLMYYNGRLLSDNGCETPLELYEAGIWNWSSFEKLSEQLTKANPGELYAIAAPTATEPDLLWATLHAAGTVYFDKNGVCVMDSQEALNGFSSLKHLLNSGVTYNLASGINQTADPTAKLAFTNLRTAFLVANSALLFESDEASLSENLGEDLRIIGFPSIKENTSEAVFTHSDVFCGITAAANTELCKTLLPRLFSSPTGTDATAEMTENYFYHKEDADIYFDLLSSADTDTSLTMGDHRSLVEEYFLQVENGASAKEYLSNFETIFNSQKKG